MRAFTRVRDGVVFGCVSRSGLVVLIRRDEFPKTPDYELCRDVGNRVQLTDAERREFDAFQRKRLAYAARELRDAR